MNMRARLRGCDDLTFSRDILGSVYLRIRSVMGISPVSEVYKQNDRHLKQD